MLPAGFGISLSFSPSLFLSQVSGCADGASALLFCVVELNHEPVAYLR